MRLSLRTLCMSACLALLTVAVSGSLTAAAPAASKSASLPRVDPEAINALQKMGAYLRSLTSFEIKSETMTEDVLDNDQKVQFNGTMDYKVRQPNAFAISSVTDRKVRQYYFDGRNFTVFSPRMGFYSTVSAPPTIRELFNVVYEKYGIEFPLEDLFRWGSPDNRYNDVTAAVLVGYAKIDGKAADQFAFREGNADWQVWIQRGDKPLPLKLVIVDTSDETMPEFIAQLHWNTSTTFPDEIFTFRPLGDAKEITLGQVKR